VSEILAKGIKPFNDTKVMKEWMEQVTDVTFLQKQFLKLVYQDLLLEE
jgi:hypothetical protein